MIEVVSTKRDNRANTLTKTATAVVSTPAVTERVTPRRNASTVIHRRFTATYTDKT
jgi:hypothetical protein